MQAAQDALVFLKPDIKIEPLVARWHAWPHLISPAQLALHVKYRLLPLMQSFLLSPGSHIAANSNPAMYGGPFADLKLENLPQVEALVDATSRDCAALIQMAEDLRQLDGSMQENASGYSLDEWYGKLPASLRGLVELVYDLNHRPGLRFFEDLVYDEKLCQPLQQLWIHATPESDRTFFMSTPRLERADTVSLRLPFADRRLDMLYRTRQQARSFKELAAELDVAPQDLPAFRQFFTETPNPVHVDAGYAGPDVRMRYFGHACLLFQTDAVSILFDPFFSVEPHDDARFTIDDFPDFIDYVVITHCHQDHFSAEMLLQLRHRIGRVIVPGNNGGSVADPSMKLLLRELGFDHVDALRPFEHVDVPDGQVLSLPFTGEHADLNIHSKHAVALKLKDKQFLFLVDSDGRDQMLYRRMMARIGHVDALFLGMECQGAPLNWLYEPLLGRPLNRRNNESRRLSGANCERAWNVTQEIDTRRVFVYAMGQEPWMKYIMGLQYEEDSIQLTESDRYVAQCRQHDIQAERLYGCREICF